MAAGAQRSVNMRTAPTCPRCGGPVREPNVWCSSWQCDVHGEVHPLRMAYSTSAEGLEGLLQGAAVPVWLPWPLPTGWLVTGFAGAGDERTGTRGCAVALTGPNPGSDFAARAPVTTVRFGNHEFPLWHVDAADRAAFAGEVLGNWLWMILWPDTAGVLLVEPLELRDLRDPGQDLDLPFGAPSPRLPG